MCSEVLVEPVIEGFDGFLIIGLVDADDDIQLGTAGIDHTDVDACV